MTTVKSVAKNSLFLLSSQVINLVFSFFYFVYMAKYLGAKDLGILSFALSFTTIVGLLGELGLTSITIREVSRDKSQASKYIGSVFLIKLFLALITFGFSAVIVNVLGYSEQTIKIVYIITIYVIFSNFSQTFTSVFQAFERFDYLSIGITLNSSLMLIGTFFAIEQNLDLINFALIYLLSSVIVFLYNSILCIWKFSFPNLNIDWNFWKHIIWESLPFWLNSVFVIIYFKIDMVMLSKMSGDTAVGWYAASYRFIDALILIPSVFMSVMYPVFSKFYVNSKDFLEFTFKKSFKFLTIIAIPIGIGTTILAEKIILFIYDDRYIPSVITLQILIWASVLSFINYTPATYLSTTDKQRSLMIFTCLGAILNIILNFSLIPLFSYNGAAIATVFTELFVCILMVYYICKAQNLSFLFSDVIPKSLIAGVFMGIFLLIFQSYPLILLILFAVVVYFTVFYIANGFEKEDVNLLNEVIGK